METLTLAKMNGHDTKKKNVRPSSQILRITPDMAHGFLLKNQSNRPLNDYWVKFYLSEMRKGSFKVQNDDICIDWDGNLLNGQHRLTAITLFGKPVEMGIKFGLDPSTFKTIDTNLNKRSTGDALSIIGIPNSNAKAAIAKFYMEYKGGHWADRGGASRHKISNTDIIDFVQKHLAKVDEIYAFTCKVTKNMKSAIQPRYLGALIWVLSDKNQAAADTFFTLYGTGLNLTEKHPVYILRKKLLNDLQSVSKYRTTDKIAWTIIAWNHFRQGKQISKIQWNPDKMDFPKPI